MSIHQPQTRIQKKNRQTILNAALDVFSSEGFRGATLDQIASVSGLSKPNVLYWKPGWTLCAPSIPTAIRWPRSWDMSSANLK